MLKAKEIHYFDYYIDRVLKINAVVNYAKIYKFPLHGNLHEKLYVED
jgi:hypothetical protein